MSASVQQQFPQIFGLDGKPIDGAQVFIGLPNMDPQSHPAAVFWDPGLTVAASQPLSTIAGFFSRDGSPAVPYVDGNFSMRVSDRNGIEQYSSPSITFRLGSVGTITVDTGDALIVDDGASLELRDGATMEIGDGSGVGVVVAVASNARFNGPLIPQANGLDLGNNTRRWDAFLRNVDLTAGTVLGDPDFTDGAIFGARVRMDGSPIDFNGGVADGGGNELGDQDFSKASLNLTCAAGVLTLNDSRNISGTPTIDPTGFVIVTLDNAMATTFYRPHAQIIRQGAGVPQDFFASVTIVSTTVLHIYVYDLSAGTSVSLAGGGAPTVTIALDVFGPQP